MFSGIVESMAQVVAIDHEQSNIHFTLTCDFVDELKVDQSVCHNGVCLTVVKLVNLPNGKRGYVVTAMQETLNRSNLGLLEVGDYVNVERSMRLNERLDGHIVQGHVDLKARCIEVKETDGSWYYRFQYAITPEQKQLGYTAVEKGSISINGVSLTVCDPMEKNNEGFVSVCIIPYTYENTNFKYLKKNSIVNIEFDIIGKYIVKFFNRS